MVGLAQEVAGVAATGIALDVDPAIATRYVTIGSTGVNVNVPTPFTTGTVAADVNHAPPGREYCNAAVPVTGELTATEYDFVVPHTTDDGPLSVTVGATAATPIALDVDPAIATRYVTIGSTGVNVKDPTPFTTETVAADVNHAPPGREYCNAAVPVTGVLTATA